MRNNPYDYGSVVPRFHGDAHRLQLAFLVIIEEDEADGYPQLIVRPVRTKLAKVKSCLEDGNASGFVENFREADEILKLITDFFGNEKRMQRKAKKRCTLYHHQDDDPDKDE